MKWFGIFGKRHYVLMDGMHSCAYIPKHTYRYFNRLLLKSLDEDRNAENSLRFLWARAGDRYLLMINPSDVEMNCTHGLAADTGKRILIPCPYIQQIYHAYGLPPEYCGRMYLKDCLKAGKSIKSFMLVK